MKVATGQYTGNATDNHAITGIGFLPDLVLIKATTNAGGASFFRITQHGTNESIHIREDVGIVTDAIKTLDLDGFTLGTNSEANGSSYNYCYLAIKDDGNGDFKTGIFTGDGNDGKAITGLGFQPAFVLIKTNSNITGTMKFVGQSGSSQMWDGEDRTDLIVSLDSNGFTVNNGSDNGANECNINGVTSYYFAFKAVTGKIWAGQYTGDGNDDRNITSPGFQPDFVLVKDTVGDWNKMRFGVQTGDASQDWVNAAGTNGIQAFNSNGFQVGADGTVNWNGNTYNALAIKDNPALSNYPGNLIRTLSVGNGMSRNERAL